MNRLENEFGNAIEFVLLDWDDRRLDNFRERFNISGRTQYVLVSAEGDVLQRWFGPLSYDTVSAYLTDFLAGG